jgi:hemolysin III
MFRFREPVNGFTHLAGALLMAGGLIWLVALTRDEPEKLVTMIVYGISAILLYLASTVYHLVDGGERIELLLRRVDHAAIYLMIAGTYTPLVYNLMDGTWRWGLLSVVWLLALVGVVCKLLFLRGERFRLLSLVLYVGMGWIALAAIPEALRLLPTGALALIVGGGIVYTLGAVVFALRWPNLHRWFGHHELWHLFVLAGSALHFAAILGYIALS